MIRLSPNTRYMIIQVRPLQKYQPKDDCGRADLWKPEIGSAPQGAEGKLPPEQALIGIRKVLCQMHTQICSRQVLLMRT